MRGWCGECTRITSHLDRSRLKADASENGFHFDMSWLGEIYLAENMALMLVTADTFHFDRSWLKAEAT